MRQNGFKEWFYFVLYCTSLVLSKRNKENYLFVTCGLEFASFGESKDGVNKGTNSTTMHKETERYLM
jgi:hypothetical protein